MSLLFFCLFFVAEPCMIYFILFSTAPTSNMPTLLCSTRSFTWKQHKVAWFRWSISQEVAYHLYWPIIPPLVGLGHECWGSQMNEKGHIVFSPDWECNDKEKRICKALEQVASKVGAKSITSGAYLPQPNLSRMFYRKKLITTLAAIAYIMHKTPYVFPIIGGQKVEHLCQPSTPLFK